METARKNNLSDDLTYSSFIIDHLDSAVFLLDDEWRIMSMNSYPGIFNQFLKEPLKTEKVFFDFIPHNWSELIRNLCIKARHSRIPVSNIIRTFDLQGFELFLEFSCKKVDLDQDGNSGFIITGNEISNDLFETKTLENNLKELMAYLRLAIEVNGNLL